MQARRQVDFGLGDLGKALSVVVGLLGAFCQVAKRPSLS